MRFPIDHFSRVPTTFSFFAAQGEACPDLKAEGPCCSPREEGCCSDGEACCGSSGACC